MEFTAQVVAVLSTALVGPPPWSLATFKAERIDPFVGDGGDDGIEPSLTCTAADVRAAHR